MGAQDSAPWKPKTDWHDAEFFRCERERDGHAALSFLAIGTKFRSSHKEFLAHGWRILAVCWEDECLTFVAPPSEDMLSLIKLQFQVVCWVFLLLLFVNHVSDQVADSGGMVDLLGLQFLKETQIYPQKTFQVIVCWSFVLFPVVVTSSGMHSSTVCFSDGFHLMNLCMYFSAGGCRRGFS